MAERFLSQLQTISTSELEDKVCVICTEEYGTAQPDSGDVEHPVRFDCGHVVGAECIKTWLFTGRGRNSCPHCRQKLFDLDNNHDDGNSYDGAESTDDDDADENDASDEESEVENTDDEWVDTDEYEVLGVRWLIPRQLGELDPQYGIMYLLPHDRIRITSQWHEDMGFIFGILREKGNSQLEQQWRTWSSDWIAAANRRDEATCMAAESAINRSWYDTVGQLSLGWGDHAFRRLQNVSIMAAALRTLTFREYRLYLSLRPATAGARYSELAGPPQYQITEAQEEILLGLLVENGALREHFEMPLRQQWDLLRDQGLCWEPTRGGENRWGQGMWMIYPY